MLSFFLLIRLIGLDLGSSNDGIGLWVNDLSPILWFWIRIGTCIWFTVFYLNNQWLLWATISSVMSGALMEVAPLLGIFLCLFGVLIWLRLGLVVLILSIFSPSFVLWVGATLSWLFLWGVLRPKLPRLLFELLLNFDDVSVGRAQGWDVQKFHFGLDVSMQSTTVLEHQMSLQIFDTQLGVQGMEDICEIWHCLVSFLPQCGPFGI